MNLDPERFGVFLALQDQPELKTGMFGCNSTTKERHARPSTASSRKPTNRR
jgi:hypothetical protein